MDIRNLFVAPNFLIAAIALMVSLLLAAFTLHVAAKLLGLRRNYETAFGVTFFWLILVFLLGILLSFINVTLSATVSSIVALILWMFLVRKSYNSTWLLSIVTFIVMILVQVFFYLVILFIFWVISLL